jgi:hypothetical protein
MRYALRLLTPLGLFLIGFTAIAQKIDRKAVVNRHNVVVVGMDTLSSLTVGNGKFAFTVDATGMQTFPEYYQHGVPLGTQSEWGWHSFPNKEGYKYEETLKAYTFNGREGLYAVQQKSGRAQKASDYFRENPHRLQLGNVGLEISKKDGTLIKLDDVQNIHQELSLWTGKITSNFTIEGVPVKVQTYADPTKDRVAFAITSTLLKAGRIKIKYRFAAPTNKFADMGVNYADPQSHQTVLTSSSAYDALFTRKLDDAAYQVYVSWNDKGTITKVADHEYDLIPNAADDTFSLSVEFAPAIKQPQPVSFTQVEQSSILAWQKFWLSGAAIDLAGSTDNRADELERRVILSQYLLRVQEAGNNPPQETGLTYNSWYGRPHMEMLWWHTAHNALWGRPELMEKSMQWYFKAYKGAEAIAQRQGFKGVRWQKMTDNEGNETPSNVGSFLIWQQPNVIYEAELLYRDKPSQALLQKYQQLIFATADFMASFARYDAEQGVYHLGKGIIPAQETFNMSETYDPPYDLAYWKWALQTAQRWRKRLGLSPNKTWQKVLDKLAPLAQKDGLYKAAGSVDDSYSPASKYTTDHPAVLMALSLLPQNNEVDTAVMHRTFDAVKKVWHWEHTWGWDFPMVAMAATRLNLPEEAIDALFKPVITNTFLPNGHNYQSGRLTIYLPGNGSLLSAVALMCTGDDGNKIPNPGFPKNGKWKVKWEGFKHLP